MAERSMDVFSIYGDGAAMKKLLQSALLSPEMHPDRIGERITALRETLGKSKAEFADSIDLDRSTLTKVEAGAKGLDIAAGAKIAEMYGVGLDYIYRGVLTDIPAELRADVVGQIHAARAIKVFGKPA